MMEAFWIWMLIVFLIIGIVVAYKRVKNKCQASKPTLLYDPETQIPVIRSSICTGEMVAGFRDKKSGEFTEVTVLRSQDEKQKFMRSYGIKEIKIEY